MFISKRLPIPLTFVGLVVVFGLVAWNIAAAGDSNERPYLGIAFAADEAGVRVTRVFPDSPAAQAGLRIGDVITAVNGEGITEATLGDLVQSHAVGDTLALTVTRDGESIELDITLAASPSARGGPFSPQIEQRPYLGIRLDNTDQGVVIGEVMPESPASEAGIQAGDVLQAIGGTEISTAPEATRAVQAMQPGDAITIEVERNGEILSLEATLGSGPVPSAVFPPEMPVPGNFFAYNSDDQTWQIRGLAEDSPLFEAGLRPGDTIIAFNGTTYDPTELNEFLSGLEEGETVAVTVERDGETLELDIPAATLKEIGMVGFGFGRDLPFDFGQMAGGARLGVTFIPLNEQVAQERGVDVTEGALITEVMPDSPADEAGMLANDVVTAVNDEVVDEERTLRDRLMAYEPGDIVTLDVLRGSETMQVEVTLEAVEFGRGFMPFHDFGPGDFDFSFPEAEPSSPQV